jgi:MoxR-like ATPase
VLEERTRLADLFARLDDLPSTGAHADSDGAAAADAPDEARRLRLPGYLTGFFGRDTELRALAAAVAAHRLVTLTGMGGSGKTRLAIEMAARLRGFDQIGFVALAECRALSR